MNRINEALKIDYEIDYKQGICEDLNFLGKVYLKKGNPRETIEIVNKSREISDEMNTPLQLKNSYKILSQAYENINQYDKALEYYKSFKQIEDKLFNKEKHKQIEELEMQYQVKKKQQELEKQNLELEKQQAVIKKQRTQKYAYFGGAVILLIGSIIIYLNLKQKRSANSLLEQQKEEIESKNTELTQQNEEIRSQRDELQRQRDIANTQKNQIAIKNDEITSSIQYAKSIQSAVLPEDYMISKILDDYFIFFRAKDIVSGDFYYVNQKGDKAIMAAVDCTGHGVPGAFMSLLGMFLINDIIENMKDLDAGGILNVLRTRLIQSLHQRNNSAANQNDGMDIALCIWDKKTNMLNYSGAYNPLYLVRDDKLIEYKGTRMSIGIRSKLDESYKSHNIQLQPDDVFYLSTDGYADQISSETGKKMTRQKFKDLIVRINRQDFLKQKAELSNYGRSRVGHRGQRTRPAGTDRRAPDGARYHRDRKHRRGPEQDRSRRPRSGSSKLRTDRGVRRRHGRGIGTDRPDLRPAGREHGSADRDHRRRNSDAGPRSGRGRPDAGRPIVRHQSTGDDVG